MEYDLVFEGGGAKGLSFAGALKVFEKYGHTPRRVIGTSAGSIMATLIAAGYNAEESLAASSEKLPDGKPRFASFMDTPTLEEEPVLQESMRYWLQTELDNPVIPNVIEPMMDRIVDYFISKDTVRHLISFLLRGGWYSGASFLEWIKEKLDAGGRNLSNTTLSEFQEKTRRDLSVVASDITGKEMIVLNHRTAPNCPTVWAVRMSMGCPFAWPEVIWKAEWGTYRGRDITGHRVVDGGLLSNFPISLLVSSDANIDEIMGENSASEHVIGLLIDENIDVPNSGEPPSTPATTPGVIERFDLLEETIWRVRGMADTVLKAHDSVMLNTYKDLICRLPAKSYGTMEFDMTPERMEAIIAAGAAAMEAFFEAHAVESIAGVDEVKPELSFAQ